MSLPVEDLIQNKCGSIEGVRAPLLKDYPDGYIDDGKLPLPLTWLMESQDDATGTVRTSTYQTFVYIQNVGQGNFSGNKKLCRTWFDLFQDEWRITVSNMVLQSDPDVKIVPGSVIFTGFFETIPGLDETPLHGFTITCEILERIDGICDPET